MKTRILFSVLFTFVFYLLSSQVPQGFNYQAIARNASGNPIANSTISVRLSILTDTSGFFVSGTGTYLWEETHSNVKTNAFGLFTVVLGDPVALKSQGSATSFSAINWNTVPLYIGTKIYDTSWKNLGSAKLWTVPYSMVSGNLSGPVSKLAVKGQTTSADSALFEVKNKNGQTIFAVYSEGVRIYVDDGTGFTKGATKGGFAIGGFGTGKAVSQEYFRVTRDSTRVYVNQLAKGVTKGGFAIGGFSPAKGTVDNFLNLTKENYFIGHRSGVNITTGTFNSFIGYESGQGNKSGRKNVFLGYHSGYSNDTASFNVFIGNDAGYSNTYGRYNTFIGFESGYSNNASYNSFLGYQSGRANLSGQYNTFLGYGAGNSNIAGNNNVFMGYYAGYSNTASNNLFIGTEAGRYNTSGTNNAFLGYFAGRANTTGSSNIFLGNQSGSNNTTGYSNVMMGENAGYSNVSGFSNIMVGKLAGYTGTNSQYNIFLGDSSGYYTNSQFATNNVFIGYAAGKNTQSYNNIFLGNLAGNRNASGQNNIAIGDKAGYWNTSSQNIFIGTEAGINNSSGFFNIIMGRWAGHNNTTGAQQILIGGGAGGSLTTGGENVIIGNNAGSVNSTGVGNVYLGTSAGWSNTGSKNIFLGYKIGYATFQNVSNALVIGTDVNGTSPLIYGEFDNQILKFNANVAVNADPNTSKFYAYDDRVIAVDDPAIIGEHSLNTSGYGIGVRGIGGYYGVQGISSVSGTGSRTGIRGNASGGSPNYGVYGYASGTTTNYGVYGYATSGTTNYAGYFNGNVHVIGNVTNTSDKTLKKNITPLSGSLNKVLSLQGVSFDWKSESELSVLMKKSADDKDIANRFNFPEGSQIGVIAQDVEKVLPELVHTDADGIKSVDYIKMIPLLIESIKDQQKQIDELKAQVNSLSGQVKK